MSHKPFGRPVAVLLALGAGLAGCAAVAPEPVRPPVELPAGFAAAVLGSDSAAEFTPQRWWTSFGDPQLDRFIEATLLRNPALARAVMRNRIAEAQTRLQRADQLPQVGAGLGATRQRQPGVGGPTTGTRYNAALDISWELDLWGRLSALSASAQADYLASGEQLRGVRQSVAAQVVRMYFEIVHARAQIELSTRTVTALTEMSRQIGNRVEVGITSPTDGLLASANMQSARQLEVLMGDYPAGMLATAEVLPQLPPPPAAGIPAELLARRPDVRAAELGLLSAGYRLGAAERSFLPSLSLGGSVLYAGSQLSDLFSSGNLIWSIAGNLLQPVFLGGRLVARVDIAEGLRGEALHAYAETALNALAELETALVVDAGMVQREAALDASASAAEEAERISYNRYLQGIDPFLTVLESQQRALDGRSAYISARLARLNNRIALHLALGGDFGAGETLSAAPAAPFATASVVPATSSSTTP